MERTRRGVRASSALSPEHARLFGSVGSRQPGSGVCQIPARFGPFEARIGQPIGRSVDS